MMWQYGWQAHRGSDCVSDPLFACGTDRKWDTQKKNNEVCFPTYVLFTDIIKTS